MTRRIINRPKLPQGLRARAEARLRRKRPDWPREPARDLKRLVHELQVHQVELELQNEELRSAQAELAQARDRFSDLFDFAPVAYLTLDKHGVICEANLAVEKLLGVNRQHLLRKKFSRFVARESQDNLHWHRQDVFASTQPRACELILRRADGGTSTVQIESVVDTSPSSPSQRCQTALVDVTQLKLTNQALVASRMALQQALARLEKLNVELEGRVLAKTAKLRHLARRLTQVEETERRRLAFLLHEGLMQLLVGAQFTLATLKRRTGRRSARSAIDEVTGILQESVELARTLSCEVYPPVLQDLGIADALRWLARQCRRRYGLSVTVQVNGKLEAESEEVQTFLFRAAQELLLNVVKHARVKLARVLLASEPGCEVRLEVSDNGAGFDPVRARVNEGTEAGFGLFSLRERVEMLAGNLEIQSASRRGTRVALVVPLTASPPAAPEAPGQ